MYIPEHKRQGKLHTFFCRKAEVAFPIVGELKKNTPLKQINKKKQKQKLRKKYKKKLRISTRINPETIRLKKI